MPLQSMLRDAWKTKKYTTSTSASGDGKKQQPFLVEESSRPTIQRTNELMNSDYAWSCIALIGHIAKECDRLGIWAETCPCPEHQMPHADPKLPRRKRKKQVSPGASSCCLRCCRAPELASGQALSMQAIQLDRKLSDFVESIGDAPQAKRAELSGAFSRALGRLWGVFD